jgi:hypothetical protein
LEVLFVQINDYMEKKTQSECFDDAVIKFLTHIESLWTSLPLVLKTIEFANAKAIADHQKFLKEDCELVEDESHYIIRVENRRKNDILMKAATNSAVANKIIKRNFLVSLISQFDTYISDLIKAIFLVRPELLNASEKQITFSELLKFGNVETAKEFIVEKEIESVLRESHTEQFKWLERKLNIPLRKDLPIWKVFIEITQRRNIFIHNDGKVSNQYLSVCKENGVNFPESIKIGTELDIDIKYFEGAFKGLFEIGVKLNQVLRRNLLPEEIESADSSFLNISFELIQNRQYELAKELYDFGDKYIKKFSTEDLRLRVLLNRAQTYKWLNQEDECVKIIKSIDWTATSDLFRMCSDVLLENYESASESMRSIGNNEKIINKASYKDWPIFRKFRQSEEFKKMYFETYKEPFEIIVEKK